MIKNWFQNQKTPLGVNSMQWTKENIINYDTKDDNTLHEGWNIYENIKYV